MRKIFLSGGPASNTRVMAEDWAREYRFVEFPQPKLSIEYLDAPIASSPITYHIYRQSLDNPNRFDYYGLAK